MHRIYLGLGSNLGDREQNLAEAIHRLGEAVTVERVSPRYETEPWGVCEQPDFLNQALSGVTALLPLPLLDYVKNIESIMGRKADGRRYGPRPIDIDILFYDRLHCACYRLTLPHPRLVERAFVLAPLADIAPGLVHPGLGCTVADLLARVDRSGVRRQLPE